jgi:hypothetical protein
MCEKIYHFLKSIEGYPYKTAATHKTVFSREILKKSLPFLKWVTLSPSGA